MESDPNDENGDADENDAADPAEITAEQVSISLQIRTLQLIS